MENPGSVGVVLVDAPSTLRQALAQLYLERGLVVTTRIDDGDPSVGIGMRTVLFLDGDVITQLVPSLAAVAGRPDLVARHRDAVEGRLQWLESRGERLRLWATAATTVGAFGAAVCHWVVEPNMVKRLVSTLAAGGLATLPIWAARNVLVWLVRREVSKVGRTLPNSSLE